MIEHFEKSHGSSQCNALVGFDRSNLSGPDLVARLPFFYATCGKFLETVVAYLEEEL